MRKVQKRSPKKALTPSGERLPPARSRQGRGFSGRGDRRFGRRARRLPKLLDALPADAGMAFILVQHLDPTHDSMLVELLAGHTSMKVCQATDGMPIERDHLYVIPPGAYLAVKAGALRLSQPQERHGARLPFDFLLHSLAEEFGRRAICVILSGTGADGSSGLKAIKENGGLVIAQDPEEAGYDGMPRSAIVTGEVDLVLPAAKIPQAILDSRGRAQPRGTRTRRGARAGLARPDHRAAAHEDRPRFQPLQGRDAAAPDRTRGWRSKPTTWIAICTCCATIPGKLDLLAKDLLINVTSFFRDPEAFDLLAKNVIPGLVGEQPAGQPLRIWVAGCSTGEETYSLAMLFREAIAAAGKNVKLQIFASDVDADAVAHARDGLYPASIEADVSAARLAALLHQGGPRLPGQCRTCAATWCSRSRTCSPTRRFRGSTSSPAAIC